MQPNAHETDNGYTTLRIHPTLNHATTGEKEVYLNVCFAGDHPSASASF
jgi:hypothetical protein